MFMLLSLLIIYNRIDYSSNIEYFKHFILIFQGLILYLTYMAIFCNTTRYHFFHVAS